MIGDYLQSTIILYYISEAEIYYLGIHSEPEVFLQLASVGWSLSGWGYFNKIVQSSKTFKFSMISAFDKDPSVVCLD